MSSTQTTRFPITYAGQTGSQLVGSFVNCFLYGIAFIVTLQYFRRQAKRDALYVKAMIGSMIVVATLQTIFINHQLYRDIVSKRDASPGVVNIIEPSMPGKFMCVYLVTFIAQMFFATRIWVLTKNVARAARVSIVLIVLLALLQFSAGCALVYAQAASATFVDLRRFSKLNRTGTAVQGAATAAADVVITATLVYLYRTHRSPTSKRVNSMIDRLTVYAINRAAATSICAILGVSFFFGLQGTYYFIIPTMMTGQLYVISAVSVQTSRESLRNDDNNLTPSTHAKGNTDEGSMTKFESKGSSTSEKLNV